MQAITIAIGKAGINFFAQELVIKELLNLLSALKPPDRTIQVGDITWNQDSIKATNIVIYLTQGTLLNFSPRFQSISQQSGGNFPLTMGANNFSAQYVWEEHWRAYTYLPGQHGGGSWEEAMWSPVDKKFSYPPAFSGLTVTVPLQFEYDAQSQKWSIVAGTSSGSAVSSSANIPGGSVIQEEDQQCFSSHVSDATASAVSAIDFGSSLNTLIAGTIASIPGSGDLGNGIVYDFSLGDSALQFPNNDGIQMGVKGGASYKGASFSGDRPPSLPLPVPPSDSDTHHLNMYVSNYEVDALNWGFYNAGELNLHIIPQNLPDPSVLDVSKYTTMEPTLTPYAAFVMNAEITQNSAPVTSFQTAYVFTSQVMSHLQAQLPANVYTLIQALPSNAFLSQASLETFLTTATVPAEYFKTIENAGQSAAMVLTQDIKFVMTIQNNASPLPYIEFSVSRTDVLTNLQLGVASNNAQTMQFGFANAVNTVTYTGSSIPGFNGQIFEEFTWNLTAESEYMTTLHAMGKTGVPLPIMADFQFDFTNASLSVQQGYISILASVLYKNS
jgi:hypothetical protein